MSSKAEILHPSHINAASQAKIAIPSVRETKSHLYLSFDWDFTVFASGIGLAPVQVCVCVTLFLVGHSFSIGLITCSSALITAVVDSSNSLHIRMALVDVAFFDLKLSVSRCLFLQHLSTWLVHWLAILYLSDGSKLFWYRALILMELWSTVLYGLRSIEGG